MALLLWMGTGTLMAQDSCQASLQLQVDPGLTLCNGTTVTIAAVDSNAGTSPSYFWYVNGVFSGSGNNYSSSGIQDGDSIMVVLLSSSQCTPAATDTAYAVFSVTQMTATTTSTPATCNTSDGTVQVTGVTGGVPPYTYSLNSSPPQTGDTFTNVAAGIYSLVVIDQNGCIYITVVNVPIVNSITSVGMSGQGANCGKSDGVISLDGINGGTAPYYIALSNGDSIVASTFPQTFTGLSEGVYSMHIYDGNLCLFDIAYLLVDLLNEITDVPVTTQSQSCYAFGGLTVDVNNATGGTPPFQVSIDGGNSFSSQLIYTGLPTGTYAIVVRDASGCLYNTSATIPFDCEYPESTLFIYNAFTPNEDAANDTWMIAGIETFKSNEVHIYNRWGQLVYHINDYTNAEGWDGTNHGVPLPEATYFYVVDAVAWDETTVRKSGIVTIVR